MAMQHPIPDWDDLREQVFNLDDTTPRGVFRQLDRGRYQRSERYWDPRRHTNPFKLFEAITGETLDTTKQARFIRHWITDNGKRFGRYRIIQWLCTAANAGADNWKRLQPYVERLRAQHQDPHFYIASTDSDGNKSYTLLGCKVGCKEHR